MREGPLRDTVISAAKRAGWFHRRLKWLGVSGGPDDFFAHQGRVVLIEFKRPRKEPRLLQEREIRLLREAGVTVLVINDIDEGVEFFEKP